MSILNDAFYTIGLLALIIIFLRLWLPTLKKWKKHEATHEDAWDKRFTFVVAVFGCAAAIYAIYDTSKNVEDSTTQARVAASFSFMQHLDDRGLIKYADFRLEAMKENLGTNAVNEKLKSGSMIETIDGLLGNFEDMSVAIKSKYVDEKVLYYELRNIMLWSSTNLAIHINEVRQLRGTNYLDEFDDLVKAWGDRKSLVDGHVFAGKNYNSQ